MIFLFPRWDMLIFWRPWRVVSSIGQWKNQLLIQPFQPAILVSLCLVALIRPVDVHFTEPWAAAECHGQLLRPQLGSKRRGGWVGSEAVGFMAWFLLEKNKKESNNAFFITSSSSSSENKKTERGLNAVIFLCVWQREQVDLSGEDDDLPAAPDGALIRLWSWINATLVYYVCLWYGCNVS